MNLLKEGIEKGFVKKTELTTKLTMDGITEIYPIYEIVLGQLFYNDRNDRIATWISQYKADNDIEELDKTNRDEYNSIIHEFIQKSNPDKMKATEKNIEFIGQQKYGIVLKDGRIIDGNRRFTCLRNLAKNNPSFNHFEAVILDKDIEYNAKQIKMLELQVQIGEEARVDYDPIDKLVGIYNDIIENKLLTVHEYAVSTNQKDGDVEKSVELATLLVEFLEAINAPKQFYIARNLDLDGPLHELQSILRKIKDDERKEAVKYAVFTNFLLQPEGDMTRFVRQIKSVVASDYLDEFIEKESAIAEEVLDELPPVGEVTNQTIKDMKSNVEKKDALKDAMELVVTKVKVSDTKDKPNQILNKIIGSLQEIDERIFSKLGQAQREDLTDQIGVIEDRIEELKKSLNV